MRKLRMLTAVSTAVLMGAAAVAQDNEAEIEQDGSYNFATAVQGGSDNSVGFVQQDNVNLLTVLQFGDGNDVAGSNVQQGRGQDPEGVATFNSAFIMQVGDDNFTNGFGQQGRFNSLVYIQDGDNNGPLNLTGSTNPNAPTPSDVGYHSGAFQRGVGNFINATFEGDNNFGSFEQTGLTNGDLGGFGNFVNPLLVSGDSNIVATSQRGNANVVLLADINGDDNVALATQEGNVNLADIEMVGDLNTADVTQINGDSNSATIFQGASGNTAVVLQDGSSNTATVNQF